MSEAPEEDLPRPQGLPQVGVPHPPVFHTENNDRLIYDPNAVPLPASNGQSEDSLLAPPSLQPSQPQSSSWRPSLRPSIPQQLNFEDSEVIPVMDEDLDSSLQGALAAELEPASPIAQANLYPHAGDYTPDSNTDIMADYLSPMAHDSVLETQVGYHATTEQAEAEADVSSLQSICDYSMDQGIYDYSPKRKTARVDLTNARPSQAPPRPTQAPSEPLQQPEPLPQSSSAAASSQEDQEPAYGPVDREILQGHLRMQSSQNPYPTLTSKKSEREVEAVCSSMEAKALEAKADLVRMKDNMTMQNAKMENEMMLLQQHYEEEMIQAQEKSMWQEQEAMAMIQQQHALEEHSMNNHIEIRQELSRKEQAMQHVFTENEHLRAQMQSDAMMKANMEATV